MNRPQTSYDAYRDVMPRITRLHARIIDAIAIAERAGRRGLTDDEVEQRLGLSHQNVSARSHELRAAGVIEATGIKRRTRNGRPAMVWRLSRRVSAAPEPAGERIQTRMF